MMLLKLLFPGKNIQQFTRLYSSIKNLNLADKLFVNPVNDNRGAGEVFQIAFKADSIRPFKSSSGFPVQLKDKTLAEAYLWELKAIMEGDKFKGEVVMDKPSPIVSAKKLIK